MKQYILKRIIHSFFIMWLVATTVFFGLRLIPGGPVEAILDPNASEQQRQELIELLGLDQPLWVQYVDWMTDLLVLDFGTSLVRYESVNTMIMQAAPRTLSIAAMGIVIGLLIAIPTGIISAVHKNDPLDIIATTSAFLGLSMPSFFLGILLALVFGVWLKVLPVFGYAPLSEGVIPWFKSILLPGIAVGTPYAAVIMRMLRSSILEVMDQQYMRAARSRGVRSRIRLYKHGLQNAMIPVVTIAGIQLALILVGSVTVEIVFGIQGIGRLLVDAMLDRDYPVTQGVIILVAGIMVFTNLVVDISYAWLDPRIGYGDDQQ